MIRVPERLAPLRSAASMIVAKRLAPSRLAFAEVGPPEHGAVEIGLG